MRRYGVAGGADLQRPGLRQRLGVLGLTIFIELIILLLVLAFGGSRIREQVAGAATAITFVPTPQPAEATSPSRDSEPEAAKMPDAPTPARPVPPLPRLREALPYVPVSRADLAAGDIAGLGSAAAVAFAGPGSAKAAGPGEGPGGVQLYNAEWVVEPSDAQLGPFLPRGVEAGSWALIACQTIARNRVENCAQLGEAPRGSGLSKAMRLAAWQFQIRPPRIDGKPMVGAWVRIRIDFGKDKSAE